jgi:abortive infection bacteriophage resistance protein
VAGKPFIAGTKYHDIIRLYECDASLRDACFLAVGQFELLLRNSMSETLSTAFGSHPYYHTIAFKDPSANLGALQTFAKLYETSKDRRRSTTGKPTTHLSCHDLDDEGISNLRRVIADFPVP